MTTDNSQPTKKDNGSQNNNQKISDSDISENQSISRLDDQKISESENQKPSKSVDRKVSGSESQKGNDSTKQKIGKLNKSNKTETTESPSHLLPDPSEKPLLESPNDDSQSIKPPIAPPSFSSGKKAYWYVVHTYSGHEQKVSNTLKQRIGSLKLQDKILDIIIPTQAKIEIKEGKKSEIKEKIFPGYLLVNMIMDDNSWLAVRTTPGITGFIGTSTKPTPLPEEEVKTIKRYMKMEAPKFKTTFSQGEAVKITDGPFNEFLGTISELDEDKGKIKVMVSVFGRETPVELDLLQVAKL